MKSAASAALFFCGGDTGGCSFNENHYHLLRIAPLLRNPQDLTEMTTVFNALEVGDQARITGFGDMPPGYRRKLMSLGLTPGTVFEVRRVAPLGDPVEISVRGFNLSLRKAEASAMIIEKQ